MTSTNSSWREFLLKISSALNSPLLLRWHMTNGAVLQMLLPKEDEIRDKRLAKHLEFPFTFDEIEAISVDASIPQFKPPNDMRQVLDKIVGEEGGFELNEKEGVLSVKVI